MHKSMVTDLITASAASLLLTLCVTRASHADMAEIKAGAKQAGSEIRDAAIEVGKVSKELGKKVADTAVEAGHATRDGAKKVVSKVKGSSTSSASSAQ